MKAVILAAGMGTRLGHHARGKPKCLVEIAGATLLERSLANLARGGLREVVIVLGFAGESIVAQIGDTFDGMAIAYARNPDYESTGSMYSLAQAAPLLDGATLILEADLLYRADAIPRLLDAPAADTVLVGRLLDHGDDVLIRADPSGRITDLGKHLERDAGVVGALLGITRLSRGFLDALLRTARADFAAGRRTCHYEETILETTRSGPPVYALVCPDIDWTEIDNEADLRRAREDVYPRIARAEIAAGIATAPRADP